MELGKPLVSCIRQDDIFQRLQNDEISELRRKRADYARPEDANYNFKADSMDTGLTPFQTWIVLANKHWRAIKNAVHKEPESPAKGCASEDIRGRIVDLRNYLGILVCLLEEQQRIEDAVAAELEERQ